MGWKNRDPQRGMPPQDWPPAPVVVLVRPQMGENIGAAARAVLNCGITDMRLVAPRDGWPNPAAEAKASGAYPVLNRVSVYNTLPEALHGCDTVFATTARCREMIKPVLTPRKAGASVHARNRAAGENKCALVFGPERAGLSNEDLESCDILVTAPLNPNYSSLNLAQAVLLVCYAWLDAANDTPSEIMDFGAEGLAEKQNLSRFGDFLYGHLGNAGYASRTPEMLPTMRQNFMAALLRARLTRQELRSLYGMVKTLVGPK